MLLRRNRYIFVFAVLALLLAGLAIRAALPNSVYRYEGSHVFTEGEAADGTVVYEGIALPPGVYHVALDFATDTDLAALCTARDGTVIRGGLRTNGEHLYAGNHQTDFHMWLYEGTENMQIVVSYGGNGQLETGGLTIRETDWLWLSLMVVTLGAGALALCILYYRDCDRAQGVSPRRKQVFFFVTLIGVLASMPCLYGELLGGADLTYHLQRIEGCKDGILSGQFPVRLEPEWVYGHGYANAIFYCNALLYLPALLRLAGFTVMTSYQVYCVILNFATAWIAWYCFGRMFEDDNIGLMCSALYTLSIFREYKLYSCGAVGEGSAYTFLPLVLYGLYLAFTKDPKDKAYKTVWLPIALGYAGLIQTHVLTCEITAFVTVLICLIYLRRIFVLNTFLELAKGAVGALGLSMWYLIPFLDYYMTQDVHIKHVSARTIQERGLYVAQLLTGRQSEGYDAIGIGPVLALGLCVFAVIAAGGFLRGQKDKPSGFVGMAAILGLGLMIMSLRFFPWDAIQSLNGLSATLVSSLQFPNRFLGWGTVFLVTVYGFVLCCLRDWRKEMFLAGIAVAVAGVALTGLYQASIDMKEQDAFRLYNEEGMGFGYISGAEYLIQGTDENLLTFRGASPGAGVRLDSYQKKYLQVDMSCVNEGPGEGYVDLPILFYKGYRAFEKETGATLELRDGWNHVVRVALPEGFAGEVRVRFVSPFYWRIGELVSLLFIVYMLYKFCAAPRFGSAFTHKMQSRHRGERDRYEESVQQSNF